ncbi:MAG: ATP-binding protein [Gemmatimonas sp.]
MTRRRHWVLWLAVLIATTLLQLAVRDRLDKAHVALVYLLVVLGASAAGGRAVGLTIAGVAFLAFNYLFLPPYHTLIIADPLDFLVLVTFLATGIVAAQLLYRARSTADVALARASEVDRLAALGAETMAAPSASAALHAIAEVIRTSLDADVVELYQRDATGVLNRATVAPQHKDDITAADSLDAWFGEKVHVAVRLPDGTTRLDPATLIGLDVHTIHRTLEVRARPVGALSVRYADRYALTADSARLLDALSYYAALGVERVRLEATAERAEAERRMESLRSALLMAVTHDLRTPLTTIKALAHEMQDTSPSSAAHIIEDEADRLDRLVGDLLDLSRIQAGVVRPVVDLNTVDDLVGAALQRAHGALSGHPVEVTLPDEMLIALFDLTQSIRILVNLLENAAKYSPTYGAIEIVARREGACVIVEVADEGPGVADAEVDRIFEPFYRPANTPPDVRGTGLGLSIARGLAEAQGGTLQYRARIGGGAVFVLTLPAAEGPTG